ncbi:MAG: hypothetical protein JNM42_05805 [Propionivibrio sp.]|uniref:hypothetical protein n=1 Tax=Propionivibrio sp. TaxID=2212460 RepID=UPI001A4B3DFE|nr:hypothetical protein [Propionivibrio sp.]MBL8413933.1 hypothetical protein [Propionivibrio sp.]
MSKPVAIVGQIILYGAFAVFIGYFATFPRYRQIPDDAALIKLSMSHLGDRECRKRTAEELEKMPPNMRAPLECPRERSDIKLEVDLDGEKLFSTMMHPTGLSKDGVSTVYKRFELKAGSYRLSVRMNDNLIKPGFNYVKEEQVTLKPGQVLVIDFNPDKGGLFFRQ